MSKRLLNMSSAVLALAVAATFVSGAHHNIPARTIKTVGVFPGVTATAVERGCAAWGEDVSTCLAGGGTSSPFTWPQ